MSFAGNEDLVGADEVYVVGSRLPKSFRGEAVNSAAYLINRCPSTGINLKTPIGVGDQQTTPT
ncbi:hypothetical protein A2U01_0066307 [Trifolium medium]|uniref:Uncharacterized protein n=1 Tax=Trifolium medium TaxID=97028 RepID=A0A392S897_9FABA|nr:hypothetical protein [Trifolium medium]